MLETGLQCSNLNIRVGERLLVRELELDIPPGAFVCLLGTNGVGKTLTLHTLAGLRPADGTIRICGDPLQQLSRREMAARLGLLLQIHEDAFPVTVLESVLMGNFHRSSIWQWSDKQYVDRARSILAMFDLAGLDDRRVATLSGGERERVALATLMMQDPRVWLLDEPMNHLDPQHQLAVLRTLQGLAAEGRAVIASLHNPALAMRFADQALMLYGDGEWEYGATAEMLEPSRLERMYNVPFSAFGNGDHSVFLPT